MSTTNTIQQLQNEAIALLKQLIAIPSFSKEEDQTANAIVSFLENKKIKANRIHNNIWAANLNYDPAK